MLQIKNITKTFVDKTILDNVSVSLGREVVGLVGKNGAGKSTLFEIITGKLETDSGSIEYSKEVIGYLPQESTKAGTNTNNLTVYDWLFSSADPNAFNQVYNVLQQVGLTTLAFEQPFGTLSGGQKTKLGLASLLLQDPVPTILLLDEPTNNVDAEGLLWLEEFVHSFPGGILVTSHDRAFLDATVDKLLYLDNANIQEYGGNYTFFKQQYAAHLEVQKRMYLVQEKKVMQIEEDINRIRSQTLQGEEKFSSRNPYQRRKIRKAAQQGVARKKKLEKFLESSERIEKPQERRSYQVGFGGAVHHDKYILGCKSITKKFGDHVVLSNISLSIFGQERIWLSGANGSGKSTLLSMLAGLTPIESGRIVRGENIKVGYFSQERTGLTGNKSALDILLEHGITETEGFTYAVSLHIQIEDMRKPIDSLSRGQVTKLAFLLLLIEQNHILILDEPTNHLEIETREEIEEALKHYHGTLLIASHDRYFIDAIGITRNVALKCGKVFIAPLSPK